MIASGTETVLIGDPTDCEDDSFRGCELVRSLGDGTDIFSLWSDLSLDAAGLRLDSIGTFKSVEIFCSILYA